MHEVQVTSSRRKVIEMLAAKHPHTIRILHLTLKCAQCGWTFRPVDSIGQRQCSVHGLKFRSTAGYWPCCEREGSNAPGCVAADHHTRPLGEYTAWAVPCWVELPVAPLHHTVVSNPKHWSRIDIRRASDKKSDKEEEAYANWEQEPGNLRLVSTTDVHLITFVSNGTRTEMPLWDLQKPRVPTFRYVQ